MESDSARRVPLLLERLIRQYLPADKLPRYQSYFLRLLSSRLKPSITEDQSAVKDMILKKLDSNSARRFQELYLRLIRSKLISKRWSILYVLYKLEDSTEKSLPGAPLESLVIPKRSVRKDDQMDIEQPAPNHSGSGPGKPMSYDYPHDELLRDIIYAFQGIEGKYITYSVLEDCYVIQPNFTVTDSVKNLVGELCELGWLYRKVMTFINSASEENAMTIQSFVYALKQELTEYYRLLALLEQHHENLKGMNLRKLYLWCQEPLERMKWMAILVDSSERLKGGALVSSLYAYSRQGSPAVKNLITRILDEVSAPLLDQIKRWMLEGELYDPHNEFFVSADMSIADEKLWREKYHLNLNMLPAFFTQEIANKILLTGKSINFLRKCCGEEEWITDAPLELPRLSDLSALQKWVDFASHETNARLVRVLFDKYRFKDHCNAIRKYLLLGQGDFHHSLMEFISKELEVQAEKIYKHNLVSILESAIRASNAQYDDNEFLSRLDVKLLGASKGDKGWEVFTLYYKVDPPLNTIFTAQVMEQYLRIFKFFWALKKVHYFLNGYQSTKEILELLKMEDARTHLHKCQVLRHEILHFLTNLMNYLMVEVVESAWKEFLEQLASVGDLDQLIETHKNFTESILERAFLLSKSDAIYNHILKMLDLASRFRNSQNSLYDSALEEYNYRIQFMKDDRIFGTSSLYQIDRSVTNLSNESIIDIQFISKQFSDCMNNFRDMLMQSEKQHIKFLAFRLDFNEYYHTAKMKKLEEQERSRKYTGNSYNFEDQIEDIEQQEFKYPFM